MSQNKKLARAAFRDDVFSRDNYTCVCCGYKPTDPSELDAHHITNRNEMPAGGYVQENGITLCGDCHEKAEAPHSIGEEFEGYEVETLYKLIGSSYESALKAARELSIKRR